MLELVVGTRLPGAPRTSPWFAMPAVAVVVLPLFARRRFALRGAGGLGLPGRGALVHRRTASSCSSAASASSGWPPRSSRDLRTSAKAGSAWSVRSPAASLIVVDDPTARHHRGPRLRSAPVRGRVGRRLRPARALRPGRSGGERAARRRARARGGRTRRGGRGAGADRPRAPRHRRPRRQRHGPAGRRVRHNLPDALADDRDALAASSGPAGPRSPRCAPSSRRCATTARTSTSPPSPASTASTRCWTRSAAPACLWTSQVEGDPFAPAWDRPLRLSRRAGRADQRAQARAGQRRRRDRPLSAGRLEIEVRDDGRGAATSDGLGHGPRRRPRAREDLRR